MTANITARPAVAGSPERCPAWCSTIHDELVIPAEPQVGRKRAHVSGPVVTGSRVRLTQTPGDDTMACVQPLDLRMTALYLSLDQAGTLAAVLGENPAETELAADLAQAVQIGRDAR